MNELDPMIIQPSAERIMPRISFYDAILSKITHLALAAIKNEQPDFERVVSEVLEADRRFEWRLTIRFHRTLNPHLYSLFPYQQIRETDPLPEVSSETLNVAIPVIRKFFLDFHALVPVPAAG